MNYNRVDTKHTADMRGKQPVTQKPGDRTAARGGTLNSFRWRSAHCEPTDLCPRTPPPAEAVTAPPTRFAGLLPINARYLAA